MDNGWIKIKGSCNNFSALCFQDFCLKAFSFPPSSLAHVLSNIFSFSFFHHCPQNWQNYWSWAWPPRIYMTRLLGNLSMKTRNRWWHGRTDFQSEEQEILSYLKRIHICGHYLVLLLLPQKVIVWVSTWGYSRPFFFFNSAKRSSMTLDLAYVNLVNYMDPWKSSSPPPWKSFWSPPSLVSWRPLLEKILTNQQGPWKVLWGAL